MKNAFAKIAFTDAVHSVQGRCASREANRRLEWADLGNDVLGEDEARFIAERDSFSSQLFRKLSLPRPESFLRLHAQKEGSEPCRMRYRNPSTSHSTCA
jgi:hypothetical protein